MLPVHCYAHRLALSCADTRKGLEAIQTCEHGLSQTWRFFAESPIKSQQLALHQQGTRQVVNVLLRHAERGGCRMTRPLVQ